MEKAALSDKMVELVARRFRTLGEPYRLRILQSLETGEKTVGEVVTALHGNQPNVSKHLQILNDAGLVGRRRVGTSILYAISDPLVFQLCDLVCRNESQKKQRELTELHRLPARKEQSLPRSRSSERAPSPKTYR